MLFSELVGWGLGAGETVGHWDSGTAIRYPLSAYRCLSSRRTPSFGVGQLTWRSYTGPPHSEEFRYLPIVSYLPVNTNLPEAVILRTLE